MAGEEGVPNHLTTNPQNHQTISPTLGLICRARALRIPVSLDDAKRMTASELDEAIAEALVYSDDFDKKLARNAAMGEYVRTRDAIIERITRGKEAAE